MLKSLIIISLLSNNPDTSVIKCTTDSCRRAFIENMVAYHFDVGNWVVVSIDSCGKRWEELVGVYLFYNYYRKEMKLSHKAYVNIVTNDIYNSGPFDRCHDSLIRGGIVDKSKLAKLEALSLKQVLETFFDEKQYLKKEYLEYEFELVWYCYKRQVRVVTPGSTFPYYIIP